MSLYFIGVGTSHPNGGYYLDHAEEMLKKSNLVLFLARSKNYHNPAFGGQTLYAFINAAFKIETRLHPNALWFFLHSIETRLGRIRFIKYGPRTIDLDVLDSNLAPLKTPYLSIPHPEFRKRPFALKPASDIGLK